MLNEPTKQAVDAFAVSTGLASLIGLLPEIAAGITIVWTLLRIYETRTVQRLIHGAKPERKDP